MGGYGSGRRASFAKSTTDDYRRFDVRQVQRHELLKDGRWFTWAWKRNGEVVASVGVRIQEDKMWLKYRHNWNDSGWTDQHYPVYLEWTPCFYGGSRPWFICPANGCGRRVAILYCGKVFACRRCHNLAYETQHEAPHGRALIKAQKIRLRLGGDGSMADPFPWKPKGMHWKTYRRLSAQEEEASLRAWPSTLLKHLGFVPD